MKKRHFRIALLTSALAMVGTAAVAQGEGDRPGMSIASEQQAAVKEIEQVAQLNDARVSQSVAQVEEIVVTSSRRSAGKAEKVSEKVESVLKSLRD